LVSVGLVCASLLVGSVDGVVDGDAMPDDGGLELGVVDGDGGGVLGAVLTGGGGGVVVAGVGVVVSDGDLLQADSASAETMASASRDDRFMQFSWREDGGGADGRQLGAATLPAKRRT
jgi:hypothetical protein